MAQQKRGETAKKPNKQTKSNVYIHAYLTGEVNDRLQQYATDNGFSLAESIRIAVAGLLKNSGYLKS